MSQDATPVILDKTAIMATSEFKKLAGVLGPANAWWLLWVTAYIESRFRNYPYRGPKVAMGVFQILPSTASALSSTWGLPPYSDEDVVLQARYALAHLYGDYILYRNNGIPPLVMDMLPTRATKVLKAFLSIRSYYHGGPSVRSKDAKMLRITRPDGRTVKSEIIGALKILLSKYNSSLK